MKRSSVSPNAKGKSKSLSKSASAGLVQFLQGQFPKRIPVAALTAATKYFGRGKPLTKDDRTIRRLAGDKSDIDTAKLLDLLSSPEAHERGKRLSDQGVRRVFQNFATQEGKLTFQYVMKMGQSVGVTISSKIAKLIVKKYGKKDHLNAQDCVRINNRRHSQSAGKSPKK